MAELCADCGRPYAVQKGPNSATPGCMVNLPGPGFLKTERRLSCALVAAHRLSERLSAANAKLAVALEVIAMGDALDLAVLDGTEIDHRPELAKAHSDYDAKRAELAKLETP